MFTLRLLIVESSKGLQTFVRQLFESFGFNPALIRTASHPTAALEIAASLKPDFLLTDWFADESLNGIGLHQKLLTFNPACRLGLLSTDTGPERSEEAKSAGALFLQVKPCSAADLRAALGSALQQLPHENPSVDSHVAAAAEVAARHLSTLTIAATLPNFIAGEKVVYRGQVDSVKHVILRRGEMVLQLQGNADPVPASQVRKA